MNKKVLFVGDVDEGLAWQAKTHDSSAQLITTENWKEYIDSPVQTGYTSLGDLPKDLSVVYKVLNVADVLVYCPPLEWSDSGKFLTEQTTQTVLLYYHQQKNNVMNLDWIKNLCGDFTKLLNSRKTNDRCLYVTGCSYTAGYGIDFEKSYGAILSKNLNLPLINLAQNGASIAYSADQILRSNIKKDDIVVWGLTHERRLSLWSQEKAEIFHVVPNYDKIQSETNFSTVDVQSTGLSQRTVNELLVSDHLLCQAVQHIHQVVNFCNKIQAQLLLFGLLSSESLQLQLANIPQFFQYQNIDSPNSLLDYALDNQHPGSKQHQAYADFCKQALHKLHYI